LTGLFSFFFLVPQTPGQFNYDDSNECQHKKKQRPLATRTSQFTHPPSRTVEVFFFFFCLFWFLFFDCFVWNFTTRGPAHDIFLSTLWIVSLTRLNEKKERKKSSFWMCDDWNRRDKVIGLVLFFSLFILSRVCLCVCVCVGRPKSHQVLTLARHYRADVWPINAEDIVVCRPATAKAPAPPNVFAHDLLLLLVPKLLLLLRLLTTTRKTSMILLSFFFFCLEFLPLFDSNENIAINKHLNIFWEIWELTPGISIGCRR
jgi:hypothetical protein